MTWLALTWVGIGLVWFWFGLAKNEEEMGRKVESRCTFSFPQLKPSQAKPCNAMPVLPFPSLLHSSLSQKVIQWSEKEIMEMTFTYVYIKLQPLQSKSHFSILTEKLSSEEGKKGKEMRREAS